MELSFVDRKFFYRYSLLLLSSRRSLLEYIHLTDKKKSLSAWPSNIWATAYAGSRVNNEIMKTRHFFPLFLRHYIKLLI